jgi:hypothetical protein
MRFVLLFVLWSTMASAQTLTQSGPPQFRFIHRNTLAVRFNPLGLLYDGRFAFRVRLYESQSIALRDNYVGIGLAPTASPAFARIGPYVEFSPLTILNIWAAFQYVQYFGTFNLFQSFPSANSNFSDSQISSRGLLPKEDVQRGYVTNGWELTLGASLQVKVKSVVMRSQARLIRADMKLREGDTVYYDQFYDVLSANRGWAFTNDLDVLWQGLENKLVAGGRYTFTAPLYTETQLLTGETMPINSMHRVGPFVGYTFKFEDGAAFNTPTVFLLVQWWLQHRYRTGVDSSAAFPLIGVGFQITGDFLK